MSDEIAKSPADRLIFDICASYGLCGHAREGRLVCVDDFLPASGMITADEFALAAIRGDGWQGDEDEDFIREWKKSVRALFIEYMGAESVDVAVFHEL